MNYHGWTIILFTSSAPGGFSRLCCRELAAVFPGIDVRIEQDEALDELGIAPPSGVDTQSVQVVREAMVRMIERIRRSLR